MEEIRRRARRFWAVRDKILLPVVELEAPGFRLLDTVFAFFGLEVMLSAGFIQYERDLGPLKSNSRCN